MDIKATAQTKRFQVPPERILVKVSGPRTNPYYKEFTVGDIKVGDYQFYTKWGPFAASITQSGDFKINGKFKDATIVKTHKDTIVRLKITRKSRMFVISGTFTKTIDGEIPWFWEPSFTIKENNLITKIGKVVVNSDWTGAWLDKTYFKEGYIPISISKKSGYWYLNYKKNGKSKTTPLFFYQEHKNSYYNSGYHGRGRGRGGRSNYR